jgi:hypothetical protein
MDMRRFFLGVMTVCVALIQQTALHASTRLTAPAEDPSRSYWMEAQQLTQEQLLILNRVEKSLANADPGRLRSLQGQLFLHTWAVDRFLKINYPDPRVFCSSPTGEGVAGTDAVDLAQGQVYCALYLASQNLEILRKDLERRSGVVSPHPQPAVAAILNAARLPNQAQSDLLLFNFPEGTVIGQSDQHFVVKANPPVSEVSAPSDILALIKSVRQRLAQIQPAFPEGLRVSIP